MITALPLTTLSGASLYSLTETDQMNTQQLVPQAHSYKTRNGAIRKLEQVAKYIGPDLYGEKTIRFVIIARDDGRFTPAAVGTHSSQLVHYGIAVIG